MIFVLCDVLKQKAKTRKRASAFKRPDENAGLKDVPAPLYILSLLSMQEAHTKLNTRLHVHYIHLPLHRNG
jgi:hypothetical protein